MKRLFFTILIMFVSCCAFADNDDCAPTYAEAMKFFNEKEYDKAKIRFEWCRDFCHDSIATEMIAKCNENINHRRKTEEVAYNQRQAEARRRAKLREEKQYIYLAVYTPDEQYFPTEKVRSDILNKMGETSSELNFISDISMAFWEVRVMIDYEKQDISNEFRKYIVGVSVEIENVLAKETKPSFTKWEEGACLSDVTEIQAAKFVADEIYTRGDFFCGVANQIVSSIKGSQYNTCPKSDEDSSKQIGEKTVLLMSYNSDITDDFIDILRGQMLKALVNDSRFRVLSREEETEMLRKEEIRYEEGNVSTAKVVQAIIGYNPKYMCGIVIKGSDAHSITCSVTNLETGEYLQGMYATYDQHLTSLDYKSAMRVAKDLSCQLKLLSEEQIVPDSIDGIESVDDSTHTNDSIKHEKTKRFFSAFVPGLSQHNKGQKIKKRIIIGSEVACVGSALGTQIWWCWNKRQYDNTGNKIYKDRANNIRCVPLIFSVAAGAVYLFNVADAFLCKDNNKNSSSKDRVYICPLVTDESVALSLTINF